MTRPLGWYVHHHGRGHLARLLAVAPYLTRPVVGLSSLPRPSRWTGEWVVLPRDDEPLPADDPTRAGRWHWLPGDHDGFTGRMQAVASWVLEQQPAAMVSDVSMEVLALSALLGVRTAAVLQAGERVDPAHATGLATADLLLAPWPLLQPGLRTVVTGLLSGVDGGRPPPRPGRRRVLVLLGAGGCDFGVEEVEATAAVTPGWQWSVVGGGGGGGDAVQHHGWVDDVAPLLHAADVVVTTAGLGAVGEVAAARRPALLLPQARPFAEQAALADAVLVAGAPVLLRSAWPDDRQWPGLLAALDALDGAPWSGLHDGQGAARMAAALEHLATGAAPAE